MIIEKIKFNNFSSFAGEHEIDFLSHDKASGKTIVLFGGLNGSGKTSILTATRLAILGQKAFGKSITTKEYRSELLSLTHQPKEFVGSDDSYVEITFKYVKLGEEVQYKVHRAWTNNKFKEELIIFENGFALTELSNAQAQSFLIELVPVGIADLFFFDGEKIKELAEEMDDQILAEALKKMIGVDFVERGIGDLSVLLREKNKLAASKDTQNKIQKLEIELEMLGQQKRVEHQYIDGLIPVLAVEKKELDRLELRLREEGGDWASSREELIKKQADLESQKRSFQGKIQDVFKGSLPFEVASDFMARLRVGAGKTLQNQENKSFNLKLDLKRTALAHFEQDGLDLNDVFDTLKEPEVESKLSYISSKTFVRLSQVKKMDSRSEIRRLLAEIDQIDAELDNIGKNIARVPDQETLKEHYEKLYAKELVVQQLNAQIKEHKLACKVIIQKAIAITHQLEKLTKQTKVDEKDAAAVNYANKSIEALKLLTVKLTVLKVSEIECYFHASFKRMTRKSDMDLFAKIEPSNFSVRLETAKGKSIDKKRLSAGEKQIYALAMIEALGKASGRRLPLIIDTPLGRLDSQHRQKIITEFFPKVNEQVIVLSTDTEIDLGFYADLKPYIAQSYELCYDEKTGTTKINDGYFWKD